MHLRLILCLFSLLFLHACSTQSINTTIDNPNWEVAGKIAIRETNGKSNTQLFNWRQNSANYAIFLSNTMGQTQLTIAGNASKAIAQQADGKTYQARTAEELLLDLTGWELPIHRIQQWLRGELSDQETQHIYGEDGLIAFSSQGWDISLSQHRAVSGHILPHKMLLQKHQITVILIIKNYVHY